VYACLEYAYTCIKHAHAYTNKNIVLKNNQTTIKQNLAYF